MVVQIVTRYSIYLSLQVYDEIYLKQTMTTKEIDFNDSECFKDSAGYGFYDIDGEVYYFNEIYG